MSLFEDLISRLPLNEVWFFTTNECYVLSIMIMLISIDGRLIQRSCYSICLPFFLTIGLSPFWYNVQLGSGNFMNCCVFVQWIVWNDSQCNTNVYHLLCFVIVVPINCWFSSYSKGLLQDCFWIFMFFFIEAASVLCILISVSRYQNSCQIYSPCVRIRPKMPAKWAFMHFSDDLFSK